MLQELVIRNFAIIEDLRIRFDAGLTILSGETGAGKSIIINAVNLLLGNRASATLIRTGADSAEIEAFFDVPTSSTVAKEMVAMGHDPGEGLMVRRLISNNDRHRIYINGRLATVQVLAQLTSQLASISGQHAHQGLLKEETHLLLLDQFGDIVPLRNEYRACFDRIIPLIRKEQQLLQQQTRQSEQLELLRFQGQEIEAANIFIGEDTALEQERLRLKHGQTLFQTVQQCVDVIYSGQGAVYEQLGELVKSLSKAGQMDERLKDSVSELEELTYRVEDVSANLRGYLKHIDLNPQRLDEVDDRIDLLNKLKRKYGKTLDEVQAYADSIETQLHEIESVEESLAQVRSQLNECHGQLCRLAERLSEKRRDAARMMAQRVERELAELKMDGTRFVVDIQPVPVAKDSAPVLRNNDRGLTEVGADRAVFMIAPNVGETIKPLAAIASGGELSRVVLALKAILVHNDSVDTVVFDEVDAGIGGSVADGVGKKLATLARRHQTLCITHLPQIAKYGAHHFRIEKEVAQGRTRTTIRQLLQDQRVEEIARMLGGEQITDTTLKHAREMLKMDQGALTRNLG